MPNTDQIKNPKHYQLLEGVESITIIASAMTTEQWHGYCLGNILKYRMRAGKKDALTQDIGKADFYEELFNKHKHLCRDHYENSELGTLIGCDTPESWRKAAHE